MGFWALLSLVLTLFVTQGALCCTKAIVGEKYALNVSVGSSASLCIALDNSTQSQAIRMSVSSDNATTRHPVLVTVRQPMGVASWALPHIESGVTYNSVERTLCPLLNNDDDATPTILIDLSTSQLTPLSVVIATSIVEQFHLRMNTAVSVLASPAAPSYLMYEYDTPPTRVRVRFTSSETSTSLCAIASLQTADCPVVELLDNPDRRGRHQTMRSLAAINARTSDNGGFFYVVVAVFPSDGVTGECVFDESRGNGGVNHTSQGVDDRIKNITILVEPALPDSGYVTAVVVPTVIFISFYIIAICWIFIFDWLRYNKHYIVQLLLSNPEQFAESELDTVNPDVRTEEREEDLTDQKPRPLNDDESSEEEEEGYKAPTSHVVESPDLGRRLASSAGRRQSDSPARLVKRPSVLSVFMGNHLQAAIDRATPSSSQALPLSRSRHNSETHTVSPPTPQPRGHTSLNPTHHRPLKRIPRHKSHSESNTPTNHMALSFSRSPTSPVHSVRTNSMMLTSGSVYVNNPRPLKFKRQKSASESHAVPTLSLHSLRVRKDSVEATDYTPSNNDHTHSVDIDHTHSVGVHTPNDPAQRQDSYEEAVEEGAIDIEDPLEQEFSFPINVKLSDVGVVDDSSFVQKKYNYYAIYLLIVTLFYSIPAYQLVITSQRLFTLTGNEDICYFNSLCSHPWDISKGLKLNAFNSMYSNIGYFLLGFLYILLAYRRRRIYRSFEMLNCNRDFVDRLGVPQRFGIHYAVGLSLMAEALMSTAYHICPSNINYQFDTTFMYILIALGMHKLLESRSPDVEPGLHKIMFTLAIITIVAVVGVLYSDSIGFWIVFFVLYVLSSFVFSVEVYYRWQVKPHSLLLLFKMYKRERLCPPQHLPKFVMLLVTIAFNWVFAVYLVAYRPVDFGSWLLFVLLSNFILYLLYYTITKCWYRELPSVRPMVFVVLALIFWAAAVYFFFRTITDWSRPPAVSRDSNQECLLLGFYDAHDLWHFLSSFALFFTFLVLMTLDDRQENWTRNTLQAF